ncbi:MAG: MerR family DNA-binding transcriptional regulator [Inhella sp.]|jgi:DNA-binding transcriptional MerR regulator|nr:MerR family DNA-binding transcriptional regulator [Inhella sp.]
MSAGVERKRKAAALELLASSSSAPQEALYGITELCAEFSLTPRAIRFYEDKGLLTPRRVNGARVYTQRDRTRLKLILRAKAIGSSLDEIKQYLDLYGNHGEGRSKQLQYTLERTDAAIAELEQKRAHIEATLAELRVINDTVRRQLAATPAK